MTLEVIRSYGRGTIHGDQSLSCVSRRGRAKRGGGLRAHGLEQLLLGVLFAIVLVHYRAMIPLMYALAVIGQVGALALASLKPLSLAAPSSARPVHLVLAGLGIAGLVLSLLGRGYTKAEPEPSQHAT